MAQRNVGGVYRKGLERCSFFDLIKKLEPTKTWQPGTQGLTLFGNPFWQCPYNSIPSPHMPPTSCL